MRWLVWCQRRLRRLAVDRVESLYFWYFYWWCTIIIIFILKWPKGGFEDENSENRLGNSVGCLSIMKPYSLDIRLICYHTWVVSVITLHLTIGKAWRRRITRSGRRRSLTGTGLMYSATSRPSKATARAPSGASPQASSSPILLPTPLGPQSGYTSTQKNLYNIPMSSAGTGTRAGIFLIFPSASRYLFKNSDQRWEYRWLSASSSKPLCSNPLI